MNTATVNCEEYEYDAEPTDGVSLTDGKAWWGTHVKYRKVGARKWQRFNIVDIHSWELDAVIDAISYQVTR